LERAFEETPDGEVFVVGKSRDLGVNLRTQLERIIDRAGLTAWPRLYQNMRASRETELVQSFPAHVCAAWIGHSVKVAEKHYPGVREEDFQRAAEATVEAAHNAAQYVQETAGKASYRKKGNSRFSRRIRGVT
jgi:hypothetical protein